MYKPSLMNALSNDYEDAAKKYMEARNTDAELAERYLHRMKLIAKCMCYAQQMIDGTLGRAPLHVHGSAAPHAGYGSSAPAAAAKTV